MGLHLLQSDEVLCHRENEIGRRGVVRSAIRDRDAGDGLVTERVQDRGAGRSAGDLRGLYRSVQVRSRRVAAAFLFISETT